MFVKIVEENRLINLENFDEIGIITDGFTISVAATRYTDRVRTTRNADMATVCSDGFTRCYIKKFAGMPEAVKFYYELEAAWISNSLNIFFVEE